VWLLTFKDRYVLEWRFSSTDHGRYTSTATSSHTRLTRLTRTALSSIRNLNIWEFKYTYCALPESALHTSTQLSHSFNFLPAIIGELLSAVSSLIVVGVEGIEKRSRWTATLPRGPRE
jgi:hypothetical protein